MKNIVINVVSAVLIVMIMAVANRMTIKKTTYENVWYNEIEGIGISHATFHKTETKLITGEIVSEEKYEVEWPERLVEFLSGDSTSDSVTLGFIR